MKTKHRKASHAKRKYMAADPLSIYRVMNRITTLTPEEQMEMALPVRTAFESLKKGTGTPDDFEALAVAVNVSLVGGERISPLVVGVCAQARDGMLRALDRFQRLGKWGFDGPALQVLPEVIDLYEQLLALCTATQLKGYMLECQKRIKERNATLEVEDV